MANFVYVLVKGMDTTPGGADESLVPKDQRLGQAVDLEQRVQLLVGAGPLPPGPHLGRNSMPFCWRGKL
jgi:hypothetical protein